MILCIDTSSLLQAWVRAYPIDRFPSLWELLNNAGSDGAIISSIEVLHEINKKEDGLYRWAKESALNFLDIDDQIQDHVIDILQDYPRILNTKANKSGADPFVIATALANKATVVTEEDGGTPKNPKIPFVCGAMNIQCTNILGLLRKLDFKF